MRQSEGNKRRGEGKRDCEITDGRENRFNKSEKKERKRRGRKVKELNEREEKRRDRKGREEERMGKGGRRFELQAEAIRNGRNTRQRLGGGGRGSLALSVSFHRSSHSLMTFFCFHSQAYLSDWKDVRIRYASYQPLELTSLSMMLVSSRSLPASCKVSLQMEDRW